MYRKRSSFRRSAPRRGRSVRRGRRTVRRSSRRSSVNRFKPIGWRM